MHRHTHAVILLGGWLLMQPPPTFRSGSAEPDNFDFGAPISRWWQKAAYDTAKDCEAAREKEEHENRTIFLKDSPPEKRTMAAMVARDLAGRCVPAEAVYPPKPPVQK